MSINEDIELVESIPSPSILPLPGTTTGPTITRSLALSLISTSLITSTPTTLSLSLISTSLITSPPTTSSSADNNQLYRPNHANSNKIFKNALIAVSIIAGILALAVGFLLYLWRRQCAKKTRASSQETDLPEWCIPKNNGRERSE